MYMMYFDWDSDKNLLLLKERGISFEQIVIEINIGNLLDIVENPNQNKYPGQLMYLVKVEDYVYCVPFVLEEDKIFLKTIYPSRKLTKKYGKK